MTRRVWAIAAALLGASVAHAEIPADQRARIDKALPAKAAAAPAKSRRVLIWITPPHLMENDPHKGYCIPYGTYALKALGEKTGAYEPVVSDDLAVLLPTNLSAQSFDAIVLNNASGPWITPTESDMARPEFRKHGDSAEAVEQALRKALLNYVESGGGIVGIHYAIGANRHWPAFHEMLGAQYDGHPWNEQVGLRLDEPDHPITRGLGEGPLSLADEIYQFSQPYSRAKVRVLLSLDTSATNMNVKWINRRDGDFALAWVKPYGKGRVFYTALGHRTEIYWNPAALRLYLNGIQFAAGDLDAPSEPDDERGFERIFNGRDLDGWKGDTSIWSVEDGAITGRTTAQTKLKRNNFLIWQGGRPGDFELRLEYKLTGGNSGIYYHAEQQPSDADADPLIGPQADFSADHEWTGDIMEYLKRDILAERGQRVRIDEQGRKHVIGVIGDPAELLKAVQNEDWNRYTVTVRNQSRHVVLKINDVVMCEVVDEDPRRARGGLLALQTHVGPPMTVQFRNIRIRRLDGQSQ